MKYNTVLFEGVSGAGKSTVISRIFYDLKLRGLNVAIIPDITHFTHILIPHNNLFEGGGIEEFCYYFLFLDRLRWHHHCLHILRTTQEHTILLIDESPLTEYCVFKVRGGREKIAKVMDAELELYYEQIDRIYYIQPQFDETYKHVKKGIEYVRKVEMFRMADKVLLDYLKKKQGDKLVICGGDINQKIKTIERDLG